MTVVINRSRGHLGRSAPERHEDDFTVLDTHEFTIEGLYT